MRPRSLMLHRALAGQRAGQDDCPCRGGCARRMPSAGCVRTYSVATIVFAPGRFSSRNDCPKRSVGVPESSRASASEPPRAGNPTIIRTGFIGQAAPAGDCALASEPPSPRVPGPPSPRAIQSVRSSCEYRARRIEGGCETSECSPCVRSAAMLNTGYSPRRCGSIRTAAQGARSGCSRVARRVSL